MRRSVFRQLHNNLHTHKNAVCHSHQRYVIIVFLRELDHRDNRPMLLTSALHVVTTNTIFLKKSYVL